MNNIHTLKYDITENVVYKIIDGNKLALDLYAPELDQNQKHPVVVFIHGGGWRIGTRKTLMASPLWKMILTQLLLEKMFVVGIQYRFTNDKVKFPAHLEDCKDAIRWIKQNQSNYAIDPERIGLWGASAGGQLALMAALAEDHEFAGDRNLAAFSSNVNSVVSWFGPTDFVAWTKAPTFPRYKDEITYLFGGTIEEKPYQYKAASPIYYLKEDSIPILLVHGAQDLGVPLEQSKRFYDDGRKVGARVEYIPVQNAGHGTKEFEENEINPDLNEIISRMVQFIKA